MTALAVPQVDPGEVLGKATIRAADMLGLSGAMLANVIGISAPTVSRLRSQSRPLDPTSKEGQLAALLIRLFRSLDAMVGGDDSARRRWMTSPNRALNGRPVDLIATPEGLVTTLAYLDGMRASA